MAEDNNNNGTSDTTTATRRGRPKSSTGGRKSAAKSNHWQAEIDRLTTENKLLKRQLASASGSSSVEQGLILRATTEGFTAGVETASRIFEGANN